jgi:hypothetical protein
VGLVSNPFSLTLSHPSLSTPPTRCYKHYPLQDNTFKGFAFCDVSSVEDLEAACTFLLRATLVRFWLVLWVGWIVLNHFLSRTHARAYALSLCQLTACSPCDDPTLHCVFLVTTLHCIAGKLNGAEYEGRNLVVSDATDKEGGQYHVLNCEL